jgi:nitrogen regulatory protein PII
MLIAFIRQEDLPLVQESLDRSVECLLSATAMQSHGPEPDMAGSYRGARFRVRRTRLRLEVAVDDEYADSAAAAIRRTLGSREGEWSSMERELFIVRADEMHSLGLGR